MTQFQSKLQLQQREQYDQETEGRSPEAVPSPPPLHTYNATEVTVNVSVTTPFGAVVAMPGSFVFVNTEDAADQFVVHEDELGTAWIAVE
jgi:hypothetical protein